jgi:predicted Zn-ribbon and HTH transcriptional regulator
MADTVKTTKKQYFEMIRPIVEASDVENIEEIVAFIDKQIESIDNKADKAAARRKEKATEPDELVDTILSVLTDEFQTAAKITILIDDEEVTKAKVVSRLTKLAKEGKVAKEEIKVEGARSKVMGYKLA